MGAGPPPCTPGPYPAGLRDRRGDDVAQLRVGRARCRRDRRERSPPGRPRCGEPTPVLVVRIGAVWCGTSRWHASHAKALLGSDVGARVRLLDVLLFDRDNAPAGLPDAVAWQAIQDVPTDVAVDPQATVGELLPAQTQLPYVLVIDARSMVLRDALSNPTEDALEQSVRTALAALDGAPASSPPAPALTDGRFSRDQCWEVSSRRWPSAIPWPTRRTPSPIPIPAAAFGARPLQRHDAGADEHGGPARRATRRRASTRTAPPPRPKGSGAHRETPLRSRSPPISPGSSGTGAPTRCGRRRSCRSRPRASSTRRGSSWLSACSPRIATNTRRSSARCPP